MKIFTQQVQIRWADIDANFHLRHSVYYDWAASCRLDFLSQHGLTTLMMQQLHFGPILFREECVFRREIKLGDPVTINLELLSSKKDYSRWTIQHTIMKDPETLSAILTVDGAWLDTVARKLTAPPVEVIHIFSQMPLSKNFKWTD
ncbi:MAG: thioesterase family protein [Chitinophagaceae bacterium]|nr:thioesterase family protein [Chitinophagaceae bacterium]